MSDTFQQLHFSNLLVVVAHPTVSGACDDEHILQQLNPIHSTI